MRKAKPKKKLEVKINEKKPVPVRKALDPVQYEKLGEAVVFCTILRALEDQLEKHRNLWKESYKSGGFLKMPYKIKLGRAINLSKEVREHFAEKGIQDSALAMPGVHKLMTSVEEEQAAKVGTKKRRGEKIRGKMPYYEDDTLPGGGSEFYGTILAAWTMTVIIIEKLTNFIKREKLDKTMQELCNNCIDFMAMIDKQVVIHECEIPSKSWKRKVLKKLPEKELRHFHEELRAKGYKVG